MPLYVLHIWMQWRDSLDLVWNHLNCQWHRDYSLGGCDVCGSPFRSLLTLFTSNIWAHLARVLIYANALTLLIFSHEPPAAYKSQLNHSLFCK